MGAPRRLPGSTVRSPFSRLSLERKLPLVTSGVLLLVMAALSTMAYLTVRRSAQRAAADGLQRSVAQVVELLRAPVLKLGGLAQTMADDPALGNFLRSPDEESRALALKALEYRGPQPEDVVAVELWGESGRRELAVGPSSAAIAVIPEQDVVPADKSDPARIGPLRALGRSVIYPVIAPVTDGARRAGSVVQWRRLSLTIRLIESQFFLGNKTGDLWTDLKGVVRGPPVDPTHLSGVIEYERTGGGLRIAAAAAVPGTPWLGLVEMPSRAVLQPASRFLGDLALMALGLLLIGLAIAWMVSRRITAPIGQLTEAAESITAGDYSRRVPVGSGDELGRLADAFNLMADRMQHSLLQLEGRVSELRESEERFRRSFSLSPVAMTLSEWRTGRIIDANQSFVRMLEYSREELIGRTSVELGLWKDAADREQMMRTIEEGRPFREREIGLRAKAGEVHRVLDSVEPLQLGGERVLLSVFQDVTEHKRAEERYKRLFESNPQPMWVFDEKTLAFLAVNEAACRHYGYAREEFLGMTIADIRPLDDVPALRRLLETESSGHQESGVWRHRKKDGKVIEVEIRSNPLVLDGRKAQLVLATDVTERRGLEQQLRQAQKMEAVGQLAGGIAHDFNNLLTVILGFTELAAAETAKGSPLSEPLNEIRKAGERAASLTRQLLAFSRRQVLDPKVLDVNALVIDHEKMLRRLIGEDVQLVTVLDPLVGRVRADAGQIEQVILNLAVNARDAMPRGGKLTIETLNVDLDDSYAREHVAVKTGTYVMLAIADTGTGMTAETRSHLFEPFFTTKEKGKGTGLGLATVYGIVKQSGGNIWVYSEPNRGTTFKIYFPLVEGAAEEAGWRLPDAPPARGSETVLLVEDEEAVRKLTRTILERYGYSVLDVGGGEAALEIARRHEQAIHLLLTDVVMPEVSGPDLAARLVAIHPGVKVLFMSGYTDDAVVRHGILAEGVRFLQKPFTPEVLARKVRQVLDAPPAT